MKSQPRMSRWNRMALRLCCFALPALLFSNAIGKKLPAERAPEGGGIAENAETYYVDSQQGNDTNDGRSATQAWKSLEKVDATTFRPGDAILLKAGSSWEGQLWPKGSGAEGKPIRVGKYGMGNKPLIRGDRRVEDTVLLKNQEYWELEDLEVTNEGSAEAIRRGVHLDVENYGEAHHLVVRRMTVHDVSGRDDSKQNGGVTLTAEGEKKSSRFVDVLIEDNEIYHSDRDGISSWSDRWERKNWFPSLRVVVRGNSLKDIGGDGIMITATDGALIEKNIVGRANQRSQGYNIAIWTWSADNSVIQYNEAYETKGQRDGEGFDSDWNSRNTVIQYNYSHDNEGGFVLICNEGGSKESNLGNIGTIVRYNISQNDRNRGITLAGPVENTLIYNNTIYMGEDRSVDVVLVSDWNGWSKNTAFYNNIFYAKGEARIGHAISRADDGHHTSTPGLGESQANEFDANVYFGRINAAEDAHGLRVDPEFAAPGKGGTSRQSLNGYALKPVSRARGSGRRIADNGGKDFWGHPLAGCKGTDRGAVQSSECEGR
jgi:Right handed beta helix region